MKVTISTHNGSNVAREHNIRNEKVVSKESHIDPNGVHETWHDEKIRDAYERLFGDALEEYNQKQSREDRKIKSYYNHIDQDAKKKPCYEMIIGIYKKDAHGKRAIPDEVGKEIMREFVDGWKERNPNLEMIGAYYHADEQGAPHVHIDYIPVAHNCSRGLKTQNGLVKALGEQGFEKKGKETAQIRWERRENQELESICNEYGLEVEHPRTGEKHLDIAQYKIERELEGLKGDIDILSESYKEHLRANKGLVEQNIALKQKNANLGQIQAQKQAQCNALEQKSAELEKKIEKQEGKLLSSKEVDEIELELNPLTKKPKPVQKIGLEELLSLKRTAAEVDEIKRTSMNLVQNLEREKQRLSEYEKRLADREKRILAKGNELSQKEISLGKKERDVNERMGYNSELINKQMEKFLDKKNLMEEFKQELYQELKVNRLEMDEHEIDF